jgi:Calcineurin-like phosphoesterase
MPMDPQTFRDHTLSLFQSAIEAAVRANAAPGAPRPGLENDMIRAATQVAGFEANGTPLPALAPPHIADDAWRTARLAFQFMRAKLAGDEVRAEELKAQFQGGSFDPNWLKTIEEYLQYFGPDGKRREPQYRPPTADMPVLSFRPGAVVGLLADWGTGTAAAINIANQMAAFNPDLIIHLGDIYYSGTPDECRVNFADILDRTFDRTRVPIYNLTGNHDMYCGGVGFYGLLDTLNPPPLTPQPASFFCLRSRDLRWQFIAMDTGRFDYDPFGVQDVLVRIGAEEQTWLTARIAEFAGNTILLSHHQLFSAFNQIGPAAPDGSLTPYNPYLRDTYIAFAAAAARAHGRIAAWFWGHEHTLSIYAPYLGVEKGRCIGHGAIPVLIDDDDHPLAKLVGPPKLMAPPLGGVGAVHAHGFVILRFAHDGTCLAEYHNDTNPGRPFYSETLHGV